jgi:1-aminocyclopropane-1-carboxylate deaminase/D-cysteine desulfhydrase-like pyridoxal-dependent ACC family enzyme
MINCIETSEPSRIELWPHPTELVPLKRLSAALGGPPIYMKRDDLLGAGTGGNKVRKLEYLLAAAVASGATTVVT